MQNNLKKIAYFILPAACLAMTTHAQSVLVDFGGLAPSNPIGGLYFNQWNPGDNLDLVLSSDGSTDSGWNMDSSTAAVVNNGTTLDFTFTYAGAPSPFADDSISSDALETLKQRQQPHGMYDFLNLDINELYEVVIYGAREGNSEIRVTDYSVIGGTTSLGSLTTTGDGIGSTGGNYNNNNLFTVASIAPDANGRITIEYDVSVGGFGYLNAVQLTQVPEPSTLMLFGIAGISLISLVRRRK